MTFVNGFCKGGVREEKRPITAILCAFMRSSEFVPQGMERGLQLLRWELVRSVPRKEKKQQWFHRHTSFWE